MSTTRPRSSSIARSQKRSTEPMSWVTNTIVLPARPSAARTRRSISAGTTRRRRPGPRRSAGCRHRPGSRPRTRAAPACRRVVLELQVHELLELGEGDDRRRSARAPARRDSPSMIALMIALSRAVRSGLKPTPSSMNGDRRPCTSSVAGVDVVDAGQALQQRALAAAVAADDPEELARRDLDADVVDRVQLVEARVRNGCSARSLSVWYCSWGSRKALLRWRSDTAGRRPGDGWRSGVWSCRVALTSLDGSRWRRQAAAHH